MSSPNTFPDVEQIHAFVRERYGAIAEQADASCGCGPSCCEPVATKPLPDNMRVKLGAIGACVGGAASVDDLRTMLSAAGFARVEIQPRERSRTMISQWTNDETAGEFVVSALLTAYKPENT